MYDHGLGTCPTTYAFLAHLSSGLATSLFVPIAAVGVGCTAVPSPQNVKLLRSKACSALLPTAPLWAEAAWQLGEVERLRFAMAEIEVR